MDSFERAFSDTERAADSTVRAASKLMSLARALQRAAKDGNINAIKRAQQGLDSDLSALGHEVANARNIWPFGEEEESQYLRDGYVTELLDIAMKKGLEIRKVEDQLVAYPLVVQILPDKRAVKVDGKKVSSLRPSYLVDLLVKNQKKPARYKSGAFLESLYTVYSTLVGEESSNQLVSSGRVLPLEKVYRLLTSLPGSSREYVRTEFARDLYLLDANGPKRTRKGATVSFPTSTGARHSKGLFSFVGPDGQNVQYYGLKFVEDR